MENPATWGPAERAVNRALAEDMRMNLAPDLVCGLSLSRRITDELRTAGLLTPVKPPQGEGLREARQPPLDEQVMAVMHQMRDSFCAVKDRLRNQGTITEDDYNHLVGEFFDGYAAAKEMLVNGKRV